MKTTLLLVAALATALPAVRAQDSSELERVQRSTERLHEWEKRLELAKRDFPPAADFDMAAAEATCQRLAREAGLQSAQIRPAASSESLPYPDGRPSPVLQRSLELSGRATFEKVDRFLGLLALSPRPVEVSALRIAAAGSDTVTFQARIAFPVVGVATAAERPRDALALDRAFLQTSELAVLLAGVRKRSEASHFPTRALAHFTTWAAEDAVALTEARFDGSTTLEGVTLGSSAQDSLRTMLGAGGFEVTDIKTMPRGRCQAFTATVQSPITSRPEKAVLGNGVFDDQADAVCSVPPRKATARVEARGAGGPVTARMRDVDLADLLHRVHEATDYGFVVDADVKLIVDADLEGATGEQVIEALQRAGLTVGPGPLRRITLSGKPASAPAVRPAYTGRTLSVAFKAAPLTDVLCLLKDAAGTAILTPPGLEGALSLYAKDVPWDQLLDAGATSLGLTFVNAKAGQRAFLGPEAEARAARHPGAVEPCGGAADPLRRWNRQPPTTGILNMRDLRLAGFAQVKGKWTGYAYGPFAETLLPLGPGYSLLDGDIVAAGPASVTVETRADKKRVELTLP